MNAKCNDTLRQIAEELEAQAARKAKPAEFIKVRSIHKYGARYFDAMRWDGTESAAAAIRDRVLYCELGTLDTCVVCDNKIPSPVWLKHGYWVVLSDDEIIAYNLPDAVFIARYNMIVYE